MSSLTRREFMVSSGLALGSLSLMGGTAMAADSTTPQGGHETLESLTPGTKFNESVELRDTLSGRPLRQLTVGRFINQQPTYHLNACFTADSRFMVLSTQLNDGNTALLRAEVETGELTVLDTLLRKNGERFNGNNVSTVQAAGLAAANTGSRVRLYDLQTLEGRVLFEAPEPGYGFGHPIGSIDGQKLFIPRLSPARDIDGVMVKPATHLEIDIATGAVRELWAEDRAQCNHVVPCPTDPDLLIIDRDWPPRLSSGGDNGKTSRVWILNIRTGKLTEIRPKDPNRFQIHSNWSADGQYVYYQGVSGVHDPKAPKGHYIGAADRDGKVVWEGHFPQYFYGHMASHPRENVMIVDGLMTPDLLLALHWQQLDAMGAPRVEVLGRHGSSWATGQQSHPHPHVSRDGRWLSYNRGVGNRADVYVQRIA
jgi:hypothetical protein